MILFENVLSRPDGSYVITISGHPYHVPNNEPDFEELYKEVHAFAIAYPDKVQPEPPPPPPPELTPEEKIKADILALEAQQTPRMVRGAVLGNAEDIDLLSAIEIAITELREELADIVL